MLQAPAAQVAEDLLARLDRALPGRIEGFYVVGSACVGAFREGRSDVDFVAIVDRDLPRAELARLQAVHAGRWASALVHDRSRATSAVGSGSRSAMVSTSSGGG